ncbi:MAG: hypothetical protein Q9195_006235 [Heterodermia aff. obscurata]
MLSYGAYLAFIILTDLLQKSNLGYFDDDTVKSHWSLGLGWTVYFNAWSWAIAEDIRIGAIGLLAMLTAPLGWGLFLYHIYLIWAGMTTNESSKWAEWKDDIADGLVYKRNDDALLTRQHMPNDDTEPVVDWPARSKQLVIRSSNGQPPTFTGKCDSRSDNLASTGSGVQRPHQWKQVQGLHEIENLYDLGFWGNLWGILPFR